MELDGELDALRAALGQPSRPVSKKKQKEQQQQVEAEVEEDDQQSQSDKSDEDSADSEDDAQKKAEEKTNSGIDRALLAKLIGSSSPEPDSQQSSKDVQEEDDDFDRYVRELAFEKRARPTNRLQTEEERAFNAAQELQEAEQSRLKRMQGLPDSSDDENENIGKKRKRVPQGDDLDDDFMQDMAEDETDGIAFGLGEGLTEAGTWSLPEDGVEQESESGSDEEDQEGSNEEQDVDETAMELLNEDSLDSDVDEEPEDLVSQSKSKKDKGKQRAQESSTDLAFTFPCPSTHSEFLEILESVKDDQLAVVVDRIRVLYHPKLAEDNKDKLAVSFPSTCLNMADGRVRLFLEY